MTDSAKTESNKQTAPAAAVDPAVPPPAAPPAAVEEQIAAAKREAAANYDRYVRAVADLENYRRRMTREKEELRQYAVASLMEELVPILDNVGLALAAAKQQSDAKAIGDGVALVLEQLRTSLARQGLKEVNPLAQKFDPNFHECIAHHPDEKLAEEHVAKVVRVGYTLNGRLLRPATVMVSSGPAKPGTGGA